VNVQQQVERFEVPSHIRIMLLQMDGTAQKPKIKFVNPNTGNYDRNIRHAASLNLPMIEKNSNVGQGVIICGSGPTLHDPHVMKKIRQYVEKGFKIIACKAAIKYLHEQGLKVDFGCSMDPGDHIANPDKIYKAPGTKHIIASSSDPALFEYLKDEEVLIFHSATGYEKEVALYKTLFKDSWCAGGGYNVVNRAVSAAMYMGFSPVVLAGTDCGYREDQTFYVCGDNPRDGVDMNDGGAVDGVPWLTRPDMLASGIALARLSKKLGKDEIIFLGDTLPAKLQYKSEEFLNACGDFGG